MNDLTDCPICQTQAQVFRNSGGAIELSCPRCGEFVVGHISEHVLGTWSLATKGKSLRLDTRKSRLEGFRAALRTLEHLRTPTVGEKAEKLLLSMARQNPKARTRIPLISNCSVLGRPTGPARLRPIRRRSGLAFAGIGARRSFS
jgi:hypothetical protein